MPDTATGTNVDSLLLRATYPPPPNPHSGLPSPRLIAELSPAQLRQVMLNLRVLAAEPGPGHDLPHLSRALLGLHELIDLAKRIPEPIVVDAGISEEGRRYLAKRAVSSYTGRGYEVTSLEMHSPLNIVLEIPPEAAAAFGLALLVLAERVATLETRVSKKRAKDLRDKASYDRERKLIEEGRLDMAIKLLRSHPRPATIEIVGGDEDFEDAEPVEPGQLEPPSIDDPEQESGDDDDGEQPAVS